MLLVCSYVLAAWQWLDAVQWLLTSAIDEEHKGTRYHRSAQDCHLQAPWQGSSSLIAHNRVEPEICLYCLLADCPRLSEAYDSFSSSSWMPRE